jgi:xylulokinase
MIASALDRPVTLFAGAAVGPANGAARLARIVVTGESVATACPKPPVAEIVEPSPARRDAFAERYPEFQALYGALRDRFAARMRADRRGDVN